MSLLLWMASLGSFTHLVNDPEEMRFCAVGTEIYAEAARKRDGPKSDDAQFFDIIGYRFSGRLAELGGTDAEANQRLKAQLADELTRFFDDDMSIGAISPNVEHFSKCLNLAFGAMEQEAIVDTAKALDENEAAKTNPVAHDANDDVTLIDFNPLELMAIAGIGEARKLELRCAIYAQDFVNEPKNFPRLGDFGLTADRVAALREQVSALIVTESGASRAGVDGLFRMAANAVGEDAADDVEQCASLYKSIISNGDGSVSISGLTPAVPADQPTMPRCYALLVRNADGLIGEADADAERESDNRLAERLADAFLVKNAADPERAGAEIGMAMAHLDDNAHKGIVDPELQTRLTACRAMAAALPEPGTG